MEKESYSMRWRGAWLLIDSMAGPWQAFESNYQREFGFTLTGRGIHVDDVRVRATGKGQAAPRPKVGPSSYLIACMM